jgi:peptide/nickel transport system substrate-binding protein
MIVNPFNTAGTGPDPQRASYCIHDRLLERPEDGELESGLAIEWKTEDYQTYTFKLRDDVNFHNGDHFTAEDVVWTIETSRLFPASVGYTRWSAVEIATAVEPYVVEMKLKEKNVDFLTDLYDFTTAILNRTAYEANPEDPTWAFVGTGPYKVTGFAASDVMELERNEDYWGEKPPTRRITLKSVPELSTRMVMLQNGEVQVAFQLNPEDLNLIEADPNFTIFTKTSMRTQWLSFNNQGNAIVMDKNFRLAVAHAVNREDVAAVQQGKWAVPDWDGNFWGFGTEYRLEGLPRLEQDLDLAKDYLEKSVYNGETLNLWVTTPQVKAAEIVQEQLRAIGIEVAIESADVAGFFEVVKFGGDPERYHMHIFEAGGMYTSALKSLKTFAWPGMGSNRMNINDPYIIEREEKLTVETDPAEREKLCHEIQQWFYDDVSAVGMYRVLRGAPAAKGIEGVVLSADNLNEDIRDIYWNLDETPESLRP